MTRQCCHCEERSDEPISIHQRDLPRLTVIATTELQEATMFKRIDHVEIVTDQLDRTVEFYTEVLHFTVKARDRIEQSSMGTPIDLVYLDLGGTVVELISYEGAKVEPAPQNEHLGYRMMALEIDDMQQTADYLKAKGVDIVWGPRFREAYARAEIADPNGYRIELRQWYR
jgi:catechol 2,3-dioxygenase-like lactoylglutathione lyase family enzyme